MKKRLMTILLSSVLAVSMLAGCAAAGAGTAEAPAAEAGEAAAEASGEEVLAADQTIQIPWTATNFYSFDNNANYSEQEIQLQSMVLEGLVRPGVDENGNDVLRPAGAESWDISDDGTVYTFHLREYYWSDGVQVTAQNFVDSWKRIGDPRNAFDFASFIGDIVGGTELYTMDAEEATDADIEAAMDALAVEALDDTTLQVTLKSAAPQFMSMISTTYMDPVRLDVIEAAGDMYDTDPSTHVWCGPFVVSEFIKDNQVVLTKNESFWDAENVKLTEVTLINIEEVSTQNTMFQNNDLAALQPSGDYVAPYRDGTIAGDYTTVNGYFPNVTYFYFNRQGNSTSGLMESQKIRLALSLACNREEFTKVIFDRNNPAYGLVPYGVMGGSLNFRDDVAEPLKPVFDEYALDTEKLQALFKEGMEELGDTRDLSEVTLTYLCTGDSVIKKQQQDYWKNVWETTFGITVNVDVKGDSSLFREARNAGEYDIGQAGWNGDYNDPIAFLEMWSSHGTSIRYSGWTQELAAVFDEITADLATTTDDKAREEIFAAAEKWVVLDEVAAIPYMYTDTIICISNKVKGIECPFVGPRLDFSRAYVIE